MKGIFRRYVEPEIKLRVGRLYRKALRYRVDGIYESALAPVIERELKRHHGIYIKSHPRGTKEGRSRIELDIVSVKTSSKEAKIVGETAAAEMAEAIKAAGAKVKLVQGSMG